MVASVPPVRTKRKPLTHIFATLTHIFATLTHIFSQK